MIPKPIQKNPSEKLFIKNFLNFVKTDPKPITFINYCDSNNSTLKTDSITKEMPKLKRPQSHRSQTTISTTFTTINEDAGDVQKEESKKNNSFKNRLIKVPKFA